MQQNGEQRTNKKDGPGDVIPDVSNAQTSSMTNTGLRALIRCSSSPRPRVPVRANTSQRALKSLLESHSSHYDLLREASSPPTSFSSRAQFLRLRNLSSPSPLSGCRQSRTRGDQSEVVKKVKIGVYFPCSRPSM
ncbi:hypothetical protein TIFTF001_034023 [Ficus carica]|uniref:Uncharacterized protein n=1 Tax=Ficus carica TaxID=3494 RepID=A0AA88DZJ2_FICCA|nr:hypothetical protein TIFTF001_034023 [Ficus carica]